MFWTEALGYSCAGTFGQFWPLVPREAGDQPWVVLQEVGDPKSTAKNRMHLDIHVTDLDAEARRLQALGAELLSEAPVTMGDVAWFVMADPEGNEFCIVRLPEQLALLP
jgi:predicted enzyme related to lactoylglutathione lyase